MQPKHTKTTGIKSRKLLVFQSWKANTLSFNPDLVGDEVLRHWPCLDLILPGQVLSHPWFEMQHSNPIPACAAGLKLNCFRAAPPRSRERAQVMPGALKIAQEIWGGQVFSRIFHSFSICGVWNCQRKVSQNVLQNMRSLVASSLWRAQI